MSKYIILSLDAIILMLIINLFLDYIANSNFKISRFFASDKIKAFFSVMLTVLIILFFIKLLDVSLIDS